MEIDNFCLTYQNIKRNTGKNQQGNVQTREAWYERNGNKSLTLMLTVANFDSLNYQKEVISLISGEMPLK